MKRLFILALAAVAASIQPLLGETPQDEQTPSPVSTSGMTVDELVRQAQNGSVEACEALAIRYRDGEGLPQSYFNMLTMYRLINMETGREIMEMIRSLDEDHPFRLLIEMLNYSNINRIPPELVERLRKASPADARIFDALCAVEREKNPEEALRILKQAETGGSELACIFQVLLLDQMNDTEGYRKALIRYAERFPVLNSQLGDLHASESADADQLKLAADYYRRADSHGMLTAGAARKLLSVYKRLENMGIEPCDEAERNRLMRLSSN